VARNAPTTARYERAFARKHGPIPSVAIKSPASTGPAMRAAFITTPFRDTAFGTSRAPTISITNACRAGMSTSVTIPSRKAKTYTIGRLAKPVTVRMPRPSARAPETLCEITIRRRLSARSATRPPHGPARRTGRNCRAVTIPSASPPPESLSTSQAWATDCIQVPVSETPCPMKYRR